MKYNLFLDDCRTPLENFNKLPWIIARDYDEFISVLKEKGLPEYSSLDHDLSRQALILYYEMKSSRETIIDYSKLTDKTGMDCLIKLLVAHVMSDINPDDKREPLQINLHSHNRFGIMAMSNILKQVMDNDEYTLTTVEHPFKLEGHLMPLRNETDNAK